MTAIPLHVVSGFLGSGKTTFLKEFISQQPPEINTGIIQNEFATVSTDAHEFRNSPGNYKLLEINNGSLFCVCLMGDFIESLAAFLELNSPGLLIMEASGLSDTTSIAEMLSHPLLAGSVYLAANWCIVDALNFHKGGKLIQILKRQIQMADFIVINKTDLAGEAVPLIRDEIVRINPFGEILTTSWCRLSFDRIKPYKPAFYPIDGPPLSRPAVQSMVIRTTRIITPENLLLFLQLWAPKSYRIKGFVITGNQSKTAVQCTFEQVQLTQVDYFSGPTELIALTGQFTLREWHSSFKQF
jgi:G3E family GTPase